MGRNPDDIKVLFLVIITLAPSMEEALAKRDKMAKSAEFVEQTLALVSAITDIDFTKFDLDKPLPKLTTNGEQGSLDKFTQFDSGKTLRQLAYESTEFESSIELIGTPRRSGQTDGRDHRGGWRRRIPDHDSQPAHQPDSKSSK